MSAEHAQLIQDFHQLHSWDGDIGHLGFPIEYFINSGADSLVFKYKDKAIKFYIFGRTLEEIKHYQALTNSVSEKYSLTHPQTQVLSTGLICDVSVNPIEEVGWSDQFKCPVGISKFIDGLNFTDFPSNLLIKQRVIPLLPLSRETRRNLSKEIESRFKVKGISLIPLNMKFDLSKEDNHMKVIITDLCSEISKLQI